ncbi:hypothetical protein GCM10027605_07900 [Micromonospora zhanjiangensis]
MAWVSVADGPAYAVWCLSHGDALYVVSGPGEQSAPGLADARTARVTLRGDHGGRIITWSAEVTRLDPDGPEWTEVAPLVAAKRLNAPGTAAELVGRWATGCAVNRLVPAAGPATHGTALPDGSLAEPPRETPATRRTRRPFRLHRVRRR